MEVWARKVSAKLIAGIAVVFGRLGIHANVLTVAGCAIQIGVGILLAYGFHRLGGFLLAFGATFDAVDGALARQMGGATKFGAFLDSVLDRVSESAILGGLAWWYMALGEPVLAMLCFLAIVGSVLVSYARARAEAVGVDCRVGFFTRVERTLLVIVVLIFGWTTIGVWILAVGSLLTVLHRVVHVYVHARGEALATEEQPVPMEEPKPAV